MAKTPKQVCLFLDVTEERRPAALRRAMTFFHERGIEGQSGNADGIPYIKFDKPDWDEDKIMELRQDFANYMAEQDIQDSTGESL